jgi:VanZ family protein
MIPRLIRLAVFVIACAAVLYLSLAPTTAIPQVSLSDKIEHTAAYLGLSLLGVWAFPERVRRVAIGLVLGGIGVEFAQAMMGWGRQGDPLDALANTLGVMVGVGLALLVGLGWRRLRPV